MNRIVLVLLLSVFLLNCKSKNEKPEVPAASFFPVNDFLKGQIAKLDTSALSFLKIETNNGISDTMAIRNVEVKQLAKDFLELPDISAAAVKNDYQINHLYDEELEAFAFTFTTKEDHPVKSEHVVLEPTLNKDGKNDIRSIFIDFRQTKHDSAVRKNMLWETNKSFQITTITGSTSGEETIKRTRVIWNGFESAIK